ncbi:MAG: DNA adenine methylase [Pseudomonadota bacterium]
MTASIAPTHPIAPYFGDKFYLAKKIVPIIESIEHSCYVEPFCGMGNVFLRLPARRRSECLNDLNGEIVNLFRVVQSDYRALVKAFRWFLPSRAEINRLAALNPAYLNSVERAARWLALQKMCFGGKQTSGRYGIHTKRRCRCRVSRITEQVKALHNRLDGVWLENLPYDQLIARWDRPHTLFYLDPPYYGHEKDYGEGFCRDDFAHLADILARIKGKFVLSLNDLPVIREIFSSFKINPIEAAYCVNNMKGQGRTIKREVLITSRGTR